MGYAMKHIAVNIVILLGLNTFSCRKKVFFQVNENLQAFLQVTTFIEYFTDYFSTTQDF